MKGYLVRIGIDQAYGRWNAPMDPCTNEFVYVPIPEEREARPGFERRYRLVQPALTRFAAAHPSARVRHVQLPPHLGAANMHLDPDFGHLTYGDNGVKRGAPLKELRGEDVVAFYAGLRPVAHCEHRLVYALVGFYRVRDVVDAGCVVESEWHQNAHTRCTDREGSDVIVRAKHGESGRLRRCIPIGEYRDGAYRLTPGMLDAWGGLSCHDGYLQRSAVLPSLLDPNCFLKWFELQRGELVSANNP